jgi:hypothetical protein
LFFVFENIALVRFFCPVASVLELECWSWSAGVRGRPIPPEDLN